MPRWMALVLAGAVTAGCGVEDLAASAEHPVERPVAPATTMAAEGVTSSPVTTAGQPTRPVAPTLPVPTAPIMTTPPPSTSPTPTPPPPAPPTTVAPVHAAGPVDPAKQEAPLPPVDLGPVGSPLGCAAGRDPAALDRFLRDHRGPLMGFDYPHVQ